MSRWHGDSELGNRHPVHNWEYADATTRGAATGMVPGDVGKWARQLDDGSLWMLTDDSPVTWSPAAGTSGYGPGGTDVAISDGGTGASTAADARLNLGLIIGTDITAWDAFLDDIAALTDPGADRLLFWDDSAGELVWLTLGTGLTITGTTIDSSGGGGPTYYDLQVVIDGGGAAISAGQQVRVRVPHAGTPIAVYAVADQSGSQIIDIWQEDWTDVLAGNLPVNADTITNAHEPTLTAAVAMADTDLTDWGTGTGATFAEGDVLLFNVDSSSTVEQVTWSLRIQYP